ncbi:ImmA/IrrE family metallo-endopeptidase [Planococcus rifietoensis]|uniref:ImmA/IrrE family metallo-endopeptidase n=1 Tax=Planococcus rifietoensis TaxID=200991 RepID=UPI00385011AB
MQSRISEEDKKRLYQEVIPVVKKFRMENDLGLQPIHNPILFLETMGFFVLKFPSDSDLSGFHLKKGNIDCIYINSGHTLGRQNFSAWHECFHAYTGEGGGLSFLGEEKYNATEMKANIFAGCIMMPEETVAEYIKRSTINDLKYIKHIELIKMQNYFGVSYSALLVRLIELYPESSSTFKQRFALGSQKNAQKMLEKIKEAGCLEDLAKSTNDVYVSNRLYEVMVTNLENERISTDKAQFILDLIESAKKI